tara:strand:- start:574 stop:1746 length:1173 start_codon:yes stop_codon:yes gene_type:complete
MNNLIHRLFIIVFLFNCAGNIQNKSKKSSQKKIEYKAIPQINEAGNFGINVLLNLPNTLFVFQKNNNKFKANYQISIAVLDSSGKQITHLSWKENKIVDYFEETRTEAKSISTGYFFKLLPNNKYAFSILIEDLDSKYKWNKKLPLKNYSKDFLSPIFVLNNENFGGNIIPSKSEDINIQISYQFSNFDSDSLFLVTAYNNEEIVIEDSLYLKNNSNIINYKLILSEYWSGELDVQFKYKDHNEYLKLILPGTNSEYWNDINTTIRIMTYILSTSEIREVRDLPKNDKVIFIKDYWKSMDPTPNTEQNEVMNEFFQRVDYATTNFSEIGPGWQSDRGRIYILFGPPDHIEIVNQNNQGYKYEIWHYNSGKQFIFIDEGMFGNYRLHREIN